MSNIKKGYWITIQVFTLQAMK